MPQRCKRAETSPGMMQTVSQQLASFEQSLGIAPRVTLGHAIARRRLGRIHAPRLELLLGHAEEATAVQHAADAPEREQLHDQIYARASGHRVNEVSRDVTNSSKGESLAFAATFFLLASGALEEARVVLPLIDVLTAFENEHLKS